jgi:chaperonin GroES
MSKNVWSTFMELCPLHDRVVVKRLEQERKTAAGIVIPDTAAERPVQGEVMAVGPGKRLEDGRRCEPDVKVGDRVLFGQYAGTTIKVEGADPLVMREAELLAVITPDQAEIKVDAVERPRCDVFV